MTAKQPMQLTSGTLTTLLNRRFMSWADFDKLKSKLMRATADTRYRDFKETSYD